MFNSPLLQETVENNVKRCEDFLFRDPPTVGGSRAHEFRNMAGVSTLCIGQEGHEFSKRRRERNKNEI